ncbi:ATP-binding protein [Desulfovibrio mangrovi]|uniref:ATP-binding protein n=1 Tax=Desulfovibrio mangrovi TaxID=2976983 RepID=UPI00224633B2|nr:ATP-binding protein [Desulfovibrio mangrovi]UZP66099.1 ATP-binding protein [Desulfovibrio mangrovi]
MMKPFWGIREKLVGIFVLIKVLPLVLLAWFAWSEIASLGWTVRERVEQLVFETKKNVGEVGAIATDSSIRALDLKAREAIERLTTDTARQVAAFLYERDDDLVQAASLQPDAQLYRQFLAPRKRPVTLHAPWKLNEDGTAWGPADSVDKGPTVSPVNINNAKDFHSRPPDVFIREDRPLYLEMTFVDMTGRERVKVVTSDRMSPELRDVSKPANTYCRAERYFGHLKKLKPGEIYVSDVIGEYLPSPIIGPYTRERAKALGVPFEPEKAGYAGKENPVGRRFEGIIRWATPVFRGGRQLGWVTLALDHTHVMEFTDHILPTEERYSDISDAASGNYAFMWDYKGRNISHPRDYFIVGYDSETGEPAVPWLEENMYQDWQASGLSASEFLAKAPLFDYQSLSKKPSKELIREGYVGLDGRYLNFAPQCTGWHNLTQHGGSGSFVIFWSGLWKLTTAAAIPYHTGQYGASPRGFGYVTIGANVDEFHLAATKTAERLEAMVTTFTENLGEQDAKTQEMLRNSLKKTSFEISLSTGAMVLAVVIIAVWMATILTGKITRIIAGIRRFQKGELDYRLEEKDKDEIGEICHAFNETAETISTLVSNLKLAEEQNRAVIQNAVEGIYQSTPQGRYLNVNPALVRMLGYESREEMLCAVQNIANQHYDDPADRERLLDVLRTRGYISNFEFKARRKDGTPIWLSTNVRAVQGEDGEIAYIEGMVGDITSRKNMEEAERNREAAEARDQAKSVFLANMSHEIRTPMNAILGVSELLQEGQLDENSRALVSLLRTSGEHLLVLINDILDISQIEAGKVRLAREPFSIQAQIRSVAGLMSVKAKEKGISLNYYMENGLPQYVMGDAARFRQVLLNLVGNAVKFTEKGSVTITAGVEERAGRQVVLNCSVQDTGPGFAGEKASDLFEAFVQGDGSTTRKFGGSGLGLAISKRLVALMGGYISAESMVGEGSKFTFTLLFEETDEPRQNGPVVELGAVSSGDGDGWSEGRKVLYVDDSESNRLLVSLYLKNTGITLDIADDGISGLEMIKDGDYDAILLDMELPGMDGYSVARSLRQYEKGAEVPVIALTANAMSEDRRRCLESGCTEYLAKPVRKADLINTLRMVMETADS